MKNTIEHVRLYSQYIIRLHFITTINHSDCMRSALRVFEIWSPTVEAHARASNPQKDADECLLQAGWLPRLKAF